jgi:hypothetical protein
MSQDPQPLHQEIAKLLSVCRGQGWSQRLFPPPIILTTSMPE